jgi:membrane protease YdiL (CAAX protease family)
VGSGTAGAAHSTYGPAPLGRYALGVAITVLAILSQYFVPQSIPASLVLYGNLPGDLLIVYGIPVLAFALLVGAGPLRDWAERMRLASVEGLSWYGLLSLLSLLVVLVLALVYLAVDPGALNALNRPNPALEQAQGNPWFFVGFSFVIGAFEETIFRGWIFGYWRDRPGGWLVPATWTSVLFAGVHLYYGTTYGPVAPLIFPGLFFTGFAFAATYRFSGGNLVVVALLHGTQDATAFLTLVPGAFNAALAFHYLLILAGALVALVVYVRRNTTPLARF